jgi:phosphonate transport system permease protein
MTPRTWSRPHLIPNPWLRAALCGGVVAYLVFAIGSLEFNGSRVALGIDKGWRLLRAFLRPDFGARWSEIVAGMRESLAMTVCATVAGVALSIPIGIGAARNLVPRPVYFVCRALVAVSRSLQEIIVAILFVAMVGFGPFAGFLTITFATIGFLAKLLAEDIEDIDGASLEAITATGGGWLQRFDYAVRPQIMPRLVGLVLYRLDINFRESAVVGIVGAGGIGATLNTAIERYEFDVAAAILAIIVVIVMAAEYASSHLRRWAR